ncbi:MULTISPECIES: helix-turn-helix domain-containing protein [Enterobacteriaceae]|uniref:Helix-turn-helix transcriptional regulator n=1 Tax=Salmonella enterica TaxID=28901 RepID=A0A763UVE6_SALER|nr:helix-turn-helix transcriptional regulator [Citrobacter portucalensis]EAW9895433.1 helix-turn-helix transcriptional regulator [Salmonella enterica]ECG8601217.1 helix-turn-helix transcriptional regulator [Salmonella enterica subsp. salamae]EEX9260440.1 helix-turn-helix transcriptional regulator [Escherichia coli]HCQ6561095.1 helix-turn-helix transcriptional regulator [Citrobacter freundii]EBG4516804.1 helix-turn-helix transcriptional regulator [Salmonella enterica]
MVPKRLKEAREAAGLSQEKLAQLVDIETVNSRSRISNYESGRFTPPFDFIVNVARVLDYPEGYFYTLDDDFAIFILSAHKGDTAHQLMKKTSALTKIQTLINDIEDILENS